jgi:ribosomal protein S18 acetylase RimI-like enzyme
MPAMIEYANDLTGLHAAELTGFFVGWGAPPTDERRVALLHGSSHVVLARDTDAAGRLVGFVTALDDGVLMAYLPLLEVLPDYQHRGIGTELVRRMLAVLGSRYGVDVCCDDDVVPFYARFGFLRVNGMVLRPQLGRPQPGRRQPDNG